LDERLVRHPQHACRWRQDLSHPQPVELPFSLKILLENLLRHEDGVNVTRDDIEALLNWDAKAAPDTEIAFMPARVCCRTSPACPAWSTSPRCATR
jgi:aconitase A